MKRLLLVDDEPRILEALRRMLHARRGLWEVQLATSGAEALAYLERERVDVVISDMRMPGMDGAELLARVAEAWPETIRMILSGQTDAEAATRAVPVAHQFLSKPCAPAELRDVVDRACALRDLLANPTLRGMVGGIEALPAAPVIWVALGRALRNPVSSVAQIAEVIGQDASLTARVLQLVNSSFFGQRREITSVAQATTLLGTGLIRSLALGHHVFSRGTGLDGREGELDLGREQAHGFLVGRLARQLVRERGLAEAAFTAGLLHDIGKLILGTQAREALQADVRQSAAAGVPLFVVEEARAGVSHAEVGAYLLGLWGLPHPVVEAVAHHHRPSRVGGGDRRVLFAVHLADALVHAQAEGAAVLPALVAEELRNEAGWADRLQQGDAMLATLAMEDA